MNNDLSICFDLGNDSLKVSYCYFDEGKSLAFGKFVQKSAVPQSALSSAAYYSEETHKWYFGTEIDKLTEGSLTTIVKIKSLLNLLNVTGNHYDEYNSRFYFSGKEFPKFVFPYHLVSIRDSRNFADRSRHNYTFRTDITPQQLCELYFDFIKTVVEERINDLTKKTGKKFDNIIYSMVAPSNTSKAYREELERLISSSFECKLKKSITSTRALVYYAQYLKKISKNDNFLVFDIGDESTSVTKGSLLSSGDVCIDGVDGHSLPIALGGNDIDSMIANLLGAFISNTETIGTPSAGNVGHISEIGLYSKQYKMLQSIKEAKKILSSEYANDPYFAQGVPISFQKDANIQLMLKKEQVVQCVGANANLKESFANKLVKYITTELDNVNNADVNKIFISGGTIETVSLLPYLKARIAALGYTKVSIDTFEREDNGYGFFEVAETDDSSYSPSLGGNVVAINDIQINLCLSLSYGTWAMRGYDKFVEIFADKGSRISSTESKSFWSIPLALNKTLVGEEFISLSLSNAEIQSRRNSKYLKYININQSSTPTRLLIGEIGSDDRKKVSKYAGLLTVAGGQNAKINLIYQGKIIKNVSPEGYLTISEGIIVDNEGRAQPVIRNSVKNSCRVNVYFMDGSYRSGVLARDIKFEFKGIDGFTVKGVN